MKRKKLIRNARLDAQITLKYRTQTNFAKAIKCSVPKVCRTITGRTELMDSEKAAWAKKLDCEIKDIFEVDAEVDTKTGKL